MFAEIGQAISKEFVTVALMGCFALCISTYLFYLLKYRNPNDERVIDLRDLIIDSKTKRLDYKKLAINTCALLQCFTWWRMSMGYEVNTALADPWMWVVFYAVVAGHDLLYRVVKIKAAQVGLDNANSTASDTAK